MGREHDGEHRDAEVAWQDGEADGEEGVGRKSIGCCGVRRAYDEMMGELAG
jgi:hypothetical protein